MKHRTSASAVLACALFSIPLGSAHAQAGGGARGGATDKVLFEQAQKAMARSDYAEARTLLGTLIDRHPDSAYVPRAKLSIAEAWHSERAFKRAEPEYQDFITFFPNRPEVAKARRRIESIHRRKLLTGCRLSIVGSESGADPSQARSRLRFHPLARRRKPNPSTPYFGADSATVSGGGLVGADSGCGACRSC